MRNIRKGSEPASLTRHRCNTNSDYDNYPEKDELRESLVKEQRGICCYCMQRICRTDQTLIRRLFPGTPPGADHSAQVHGELGGA